MIRIDALRRLTAGFGLCLGVQIAAALAATLFTAPALADEAVQTRAALIPDGARLVFDWPAPVAFTTTLSGNRLTISFERPLAATFDNVLEALPGQVRAMDIAGNGQNVVVTLAQPSHVRSFAQGDLVVVDLKPVAGGESPTAVAEREVPDSEAETADASQPAERTPDQVAGQPSDPAARPAAAPPDPPAAPVMVDGLLSVRYGLHETYDRIVFDWPERVPYTVANDGGIVRIRFEAAARIDSDRLAAQLPDRRVRLVDARGGDDALEVTLAVPPGARVRDFYNLTKTVIDVYRDPSGAAPAAVPERPATPDQMAAAEPAETPEPIETPEPEAAVEDAVPEAAVEPAGPDATPDADEPDTVAEDPEEDATTEPESESENRTALSSLPPTLGGTPGRGILAGQPTGAADRAVADPQEGDAAPASMPDVALAEPLHEPEAEEPSSAPERADSADTTPETAAPETDAGAPAQGAGDLAAVEPTPRRADVAQPEARDAEDAESEPDGRETSADAPEAQDDVGSEEGQPRVDLVVIQGDFEALMRLRWSEPVRAAVVRRGTRVWIAFDQEVESFDLSAVEAGAGQLYSDPAVAQSEGGIVFSVQVEDEVEPRVTAAGNTWYVQLRPRRSESAVALMPERFEDPVLGPAIAFAAADADAPPLDPGEPLEVEDPEVGDRLVLVPLGAPSTGLTEVASFIQFNAILSAQGMAFERLSDDVVVRSNNDRVEVLASGGLILSDDQARRPIRNESEHAADERAVPDDDTAAEVQTASSAPRGGGVGAFRLFDQQTWRDEHSGRFAAVSRALQNAAAEAASPDARAEARARFARFLFSYDQFRDAASVLRMIASDTPRLLRADASLLALRGASAYMNGDLDQALSDLSDTRLRPSGEAQFWRAAVLAALGQYDQAETVYAEQAVVPDWYAPKLYVPLALASVDTALAVDNLERGQEVLDSLPYFGLEPQLAAQVALRRATAAWRSGDRESAQQEWQDVIDGRAHGLAARAVVERTSALYGAGQITAAEAAQALDDIRFDWRGDHFEYDLLLQLAHYQFEAGDYRSGFRTLKHARAMFANDVDRTEVNARLASAFADLFGPEPPASVSPVTAIALYSEFEDLAPDGPERDAMLRRLAGRLVSIDLYDAAARVLHSLLSPELLGPPRGELGRDLAVLYLAADQPQSAVDAIEETRARAFSDALETERRHLRASAHLALDDYGSALDALAGDDSRAADMLRAEVNWRQGDWPAAAQGFGRLVEGTSFVWPPQQQAPDQPSAAATDGTGDERMGPALPSADQAAALDEPDAAIPEELLPERPANFAPRTAPLSEFAAQQVLNWAMALTHADDEPGLAYLSQRYGAVMAETPYAEMFRLLVTDDIDPIESVADLGRVGPSIDMFERFLTSYRERLAAELADPEGDEADGAGEEPEPETEMETGAEAGGERTTAAG